jgi:hypothetical protein
MTLPAVVGELVAKWRKQASVSNYPFDSSERAARSRCADELESTLSALTAEAGKVNELSGNSGQLPEAGKGECRLGLLLTADEIKFASEHAHAIVNAPGSWVKLDDAIEYARSLSTATPAGEWIDAGLVPRSAKDFVIGFDFDDVGNSVYDAFDEMWHELGTMLAASPRGASAATPQEPCNGAL